LRFFFFFCFLGEKGKLFIYLFILPLDHILFIYLIFTINLFTCAYIVWVISLS
jgi:hypothetical protein